MDSCQILTLKDIRMEKMKKPLLVKRPFHVLPQELRDLIGEYLNLLFGKYENISKFIPDWKFVKKSASITQGPKTLESFDFLELLTFTRVSIRMKNHAIVEWINMYLSFMAMMDYYYTFGTIEFIFLNSNFYHVRPWDTKNFSVQKFLSICESERLIKHKTEFGTIGKNLQSHQLYIPTNSFYQMRWYLESISLCPTKWTYILQKNFQMVLYLQEKDWNVIDCMKYELEPYFKSGILRIRGLRVNLHEDKNQWVSKLKEYKNSYLVIDQLMVRVIPCTIHLFDIILQHHQLFQSISICPDEKWDEECIQKMEQILKNHIHTTQKLECDYRLMNRHPIESWHIYIPTLCIFWIPFCFLLKHLTEETHIKRIISLFDNVENKNLEEKKILLNMVQPQWEKMWTLKLKFHPQFELMRKQT